MAEAETHQSAPVVKPVQAKKLKIDGKKVAYYNAFATSFAIFFGVAVLFNAIGILITTQAKKASWSFGIPLSSIFASWDISYVPNVVLFAFLALALAIFGLLSINKITDAEALKKAWKCNSKVFFLLAGLYGVAALATCVYALMYIKKGAGPTQKSLWLNGFIPTLVMGGVSAFIGAISKSIANGKTALVRVMAYIAISIASVSFIMMFIEELVDIHSKKSSALDTIENYTDSIWDFLK
jgi:hypothetical protein